MTTQKPALEIKTKQLQITAKRTTNILDKGDEESIERHLATLRTIISDVEKLRLDVKVEKLAAEEDTSEWENDINGKIALADESVRATKVWLNDNQKSEMRWSEKRRYSLR